MKKKYQVQIEPVSTGGKILKRGQFLELTDEAAEPLLQTGVISLAPVVEKKQPPPPPSDDNKENK